MIIWLDAQLSPALAPWIQTRFGIEAVAIRELGLRDAADRTIFLAARGRNAVVMTKDQDFVQLLRVLGPPPQVIWITCGNTTNKHLQHVLEATLPQAIAFLQNGEELVEIRGL